MRFLFLLFIPVILHSQTVHQEDDKIVYKGKVPFVSINSTGKHNFIQEAFLSAINKEGKVLSTSATNDKRFTIVAEFPLAATAAIDKSTIFSVTGHIHPNEYSYKIDSVQIVEHIRGGKTTTISSEDFLKRMDQTGDVAMFTERALNEIDMRIQKLLASANKIVQNITASK
jgi:hypothetical protein